MTLSSGQKKIVHMAVLGFATGILAYLSALIVGAPLPGVRALVLSLLVAGVSRAAGAVLGGLETKEPEK
jgi:hypothetical protein